MYDRRGPVYVVKVATNKDITMDPEFPTEDPPSKTSPAVPKQPTVNVSIHPHGVMSGATPGCNVTMDITDDLPAARIGEAVTLAVHRAWKRGYDPARDDFVVLVTFR